MDAARLCLPAQLVLATALLCAQAAQAQAIHKCMVDGKLVFQSAPCVLEPPAGAASAPVSVASVNPAAPKKKTLAEVLRERDGGVHAQPAAREAQGDGANLLRSRMGAL